MVNLVCLPGTVCSDRVPLRSSTARRTTSMPTPRPLATVGLFANRETRRAEHVQQSLGIIQSFILEHAGDLGPGANFSRIDAATVILHLQGHGFSGGPGPQGDLTRCRFTGRYAFLRCFESVADRVAHQMQQWIHHAFNDELVDFRFLAAELQVYLLVRFASQVPNDELHAGEHFTEWTPCALA